jgi:transcriptional regulator with XRE-family HTH domain
MQASFQLLPYTAAIMSAAKQPSRLRQFREAAGLSVRELARQIGEQHTNVSFWERTGTLPRSNVLAPIAQALGVTVEDLLGDAATRRAGVPGSRVRRMFEQVQRLPRRQQDKICELLEPYLAKNATSVEKAG